MKRTCVRSPDRSRSRTVRLLAGKITRAEAPQGPGRETSGLATVPIAVVEGLGIRMTSRPGLGTTATDEVGTGDDQRDVEPCLSGDELVGPVGIAALDHGGADEIATMSGEPVTQNSVVLNACLSRSPGGGERGPGDGPNRCAGYRASLQLPCFALPVFGCPAWAVQGDPAGHARPICSQTGWAGASPCEAMLSSLPSLNVYPLRHRPNRCSAPPIDPCPSLSPSVTQTAAFHAKRRFSSKAAIRLGVSRKSSQVSVFAPGGPLGSKFLSHGSGQTQRQSRDRGGELWQRTRVFYKELRMARCP